MADIDWIASMKQKQNHPEGDGLNDFWTESDGTNGFQWKWTVSKRFKVKVKKIRVVTLVFRMLVFS